MKLYRLGLGGVLCAVLALSSLGAAAELPARELTLSSSIQLALENNLAVQAAESQRTGAIAKVSEAKTLALPKLSASGNYTRVDESSYTALLQGSQNSYDVRLSVSQPLYTGGALPAALKAAVAGNKSAELDYQARCQEVALQVANAYYGHLASEQLVKISEEAVTNAQAHLDVVKASFEAGTVLKTDVLRTELALGQARQNLIKAQNTLELARLGLVMAVGLPSETRVILAKPAVETPQKPSGSISDDLLLANAERPDLLSARAQLDLGAAAVAQARAGLLPSLALVAIQDYSGTEVDDLDGSWSVMLNASFNVFDWGAAKAKVTQARESKKALDLRAKGLEDQIRLEVSQARQAVIEAAERIPLAQASEVQAKDNLELTKVRFDAGLATTVDVLDGQMLLTQTEAAAVQAIYDYNLAKARLAKALGEADRIK